MQPLSPLLLTRESEPNFELLRRYGWSVNTISGTYWGSHYVGARRI